MSGAKFKVTRFKPFLYKASGRAICWYRTFKMYMKVYPCDLYMTEPFIFEFIFLTQKDCRISDSTNRSDLM